MTTNIQKNGQKWTVQSSQGKWVIGVFVLCAIFFYVWRSSVSQQAKIANENDHISEAVVAADEWLSGKSHDNAEMVERQLTDALASELATNKIEGQTVLKKVRERREQLTLQAIFEEAMQNIDSFQVAEAVTLLRKYTAKRNAINNAEAQQLLAEAEIAVSDTLALETLDIMNDEYFDRVKASGEIIDDGRVKHPALLAVRKATIQRNMAKATQRRDADRLVAIERQKSEFEKQEREAARRAEQERLRAERERPRDGTDDFKQITTFPERYMGMNIYIRGLLYPGSTQRNRQFKCFAVRFALNSAVDGGPYRDRLSFITTEEMGAALIEMPGQGYKATVHVKLRYLDPKKEEYPVGDVLKIEFSEFDVKVAKEYKAVTVHTDGRVETHPNPFKK